ncbi:MAG: hypothetical protein EOO73_10810 [Myxococcales bacterium]|nr:MAG: hypothetical protein EOO73_10810 [Myxococcales bacterium]
MSNRHIGTRMLVFAAAIFGCSDPAQLSAAEHAAGAGNLSAGGDGTGESAGAGGANTNGSELFPEANPPSLSSLDRMMVHPDEVVTASGSHFLPAPRVLLNGQVIESDLATDTRLAFHVGSVLLSGVCNAISDVAIQNENGTSTSIPLEIVANAPDIEHITSPLIAGEPAVVEGRHLGDASVTVDDRILMLSSSSDTSIAVQLPEDLPGGSHILKLATTCGTWAIDVSVLPPIPVIVSLAEEEVTPGGIVFAVVRNSGPGIVTRALLDSAVVGDSDPTQFLWRQGSESELAVRIPFAALPGTVQFRVESASGVSNASELSIGKLPGTPYPIASSVILFPPTRSEIKGALSAFPLGEQNGSCFPLRASPRWCYRLFATDFDLSSPHDGPAICDGVGTIKGEERYFDHDLTADPGPAENGLLARHPIRGEVSVSGTTNQITITIDRTSSGAGSPEPYVGGWVSDEVPPEATEVVGAGQVYTTVIGANLVLRSRTTGQELEIGHRMNASSSPYPFGCANSW